MLRPSNARRTLAVVSALTLALVACSNDDADGDAAPPADGDGSTTTEATVDPERCPVDALDDASGPVTIDFWHGMTAENETTLEALTDEYNASQDRVQVNLVYQGSYDETAQQYFAAARGGELPSLVQMEETRLQMAIDSQTMLPVQACIEADDYDTSDHLPVVIDQYTVEGQLWPMPFNTSGPVLYYNTTMFDSIGLTEDDVPTSLDELRTVSEQVVSSGSAPYGFALELSPWYLEQWFAMDGEPLVDNDNGRTGRATTTNLDSETGQMIFAFVDDMVEDGLATNIGRNTSAVDALLAIANEDVAMTFGTSAALGSILSVLESGQFPDVGVGVAPLPGPTGGGILVGGAAIWLVEREQTDAERAAAWDYVRFLNEPEQQATWHTGTGYMPIRQAAIELPEVAELWADQPFFRVAYDQLLASEADFGGPVVGDYAGMRDAIVQGLERMLLQDIAPEVVTAEVAEEAEAAIEAYNSSVDR
ncbi:MAG: ABC transporter substrate-binding protein [Acidimicrobiales bacterium]